MGIYRSEFLCYGKICTEEEYNFNTFDMELKYYKDINNNYIVTYNKDIIKWPKFNSGNLEVIENEIDGKHLDLNVINELYKSYNIELNVKKDYDLYYVYDCFMSFNYTRETNVIKCVNYLEVESQDRIKQLREILNEKQIDSDSDDEW